MPLTSDYNSSSSFYVFTNTAVNATVLRLAFPDEKLQSGAALLHLVLISVGQHIVSLPPLHWDSGFGQLTAESYSIALLHLNIFQFLEESDGPLYRKPQVKHQNY